MEKEIQAIISFASFFKDPGYNRLSAVVGQKTWPILKSHLIYFLRNFCVKDNYHVYRKYLRLFFYANQIKYTILNL